MTRWFFLASRSVNLLITSEGLEVPSESCDVQTICHAGSVTSQTGGKKKSSSLVSSKHRNCLMSFGILKPV